jgi:hypothetical protein
MPAIIPDPVGQAIVRFVAGADDEVALEEIDAVPPLLSLVCAELNAQRLDAGEVQITQAQFEGHGSDILSSFYVRSFELGTYGAALEGIAEAGAALKNLRCLIEDRLLSPDGFRESIAYDTIVRDRTHAAHADASRAVLDALVERRLLTVEERGGVRRLELAHDVLTRIVKASRDERHEVEALAQARSEKERAEAETWRMLKERNRLRTLAILAFALAVIAAGGAVLGWVGLKRSRDATDQAVRARNQAVEAKNQAISSEKTAVQARDEAEDAEKKAVDARNQAMAAKNEAQLGFDAAWKGLTTLYDSYAAGTLENTQGISAAQANKLKSKLRGHLLEQLHKLNQERPDHEGTILYIARLLLDEGVEANAEAQYTRAKERLAEALKWSQKRPIAKVEEAEVYADILVEQSLANTYLSNPKEGNALAGSNLGMIRKLVSEFPDSWRLQSAALRLEYLATPLGPQTRQAVLAVAERFEPLIEKSAWHYDAVFWQFRMKDYAYWGDRNSAKSASDYASERKLIAWFRERVVESEKYSLAQVERAAARFADDLSSVDQQLSSANDKTTADARRGILSELEATLKALETRLPKSALVYGARGNLLRLQEKSVKEGINTRSPDDLRVALQKHRLVAAALGVGSSVADMLEPAFKAYTAANADKAARDAALATAQSSARDFMSLDLVGADTVLQSSDISIAVDKLREGKTDDPLLALHGQMVEQFIRLYDAAGPDARSALLGTFSAATVAAVEHWFSIGQFDKVAAFAHASFEGLPIPTFTAPDKEGFVRQLNRCIRSLIKLKRYDEARRLLDDTLLLCDKILAERPWDWYLNVAFNSLCFDVAAEWTSIGDKKAAQPLLRRGWRRQLQLYGEEIDLDHYPELPQRGVVPPKAPAADAPFFRRFEPNAIRTGVRRFTIQTDFSGVSYPFYVYVYSGKNGYAELMDQVRWVKEIRGGTVPDETLTRFKQIRDNALKIKRDFQSLFFEEFGTTGESHQLRLDTAIAELKKRESEYSKEKTDANRTALAAAYSMPAYQGLFRERFTDAVNWARKSIELDSSSNPAARANLATAHLFQGRYYEALKIYRDHWQDPLNGKTLGHATLADFEELEKSGVTHPDVARVKSAMATRKGAPADGTEKKAVETKKDTVKPEK